MQLKKEISVGNIVSIFSSFVMIGIVWGTDHARLDGHDKVLDNQAADIHKLQDENIKETEARASLSQALAVLATTVNDNIKQKHD
jgi:hypothetical protein